MSKERGWEGGRGWERGGERWWEGGGRERGRDKTESE